MHKDLQVSQGSQASVDRQEWQDPEGPRDPAANQDPRDHPGLKGLKDSSASLERLEI